MNAQPVAPVSIKAGQEKVCACEFNFVLITNDLFCSAFPTNDADCINKADVLLVCPQLRLRLRTSLLLGCPERLRLEM